MRSVTVYTNPGCQPCKATKRKLDELGVAYDVVELELPENTGKLEELKAEGFTQAPIVEAIPGLDDATRSVWTGYRPDLLPRLAA